MIRLILHDPAPQRVWPISPGMRVIAGRNEDATVSIPEDSFLSSQHFAIEWDGAACLLHDLDSRNGTRVNGSPVQRIGLHDRDQISAGQVQFTVHMEGDQPKPAAPLTEVLFRSSPVLGLVDAASNAELFYRIARSGQKFQSLYEGDQGMQLGAYGPCLVALEASHAFTQYLLQEGWGKAWCTYLHSAEPLESVRHHLRRFLTVRWPNGQMMYFRFHDPRILRQFLPTCSPEQAADFFGPVTSYMVEGRAPQTAIRFSHVNGRISQEEFGVS